MAVVMVYKRRECRIMLAFHWLLQILLKLTVFLLSLCVELLTNNFLLLFTSQLNVQYKTLVFRCKQKGSIYINALSSDWLHVGWSGILIQLPGTRDLSLQNVETNSRVHAIVYLICMGILSFGVQWLGCDVDHLPPSSAKVKNNSLYAFMVCIGTPLPFTFVLSWEWWGRMINPLK